MAVCRICLAINVRFFSIADTPLQLVYERLTNSTLHTTDKRPVAACYICHAQLKKCYKFMISSAKSEIILSALIEKCSKITIQSVSQIDRKDFSLCNSLTVSRPEYFDTLLMLPTNVVVKMEQQLDDNVNMEIEDQVSLVSMQSPVLEASFLQNDPMSIQQCPTAMNIKLEGENIEDTFSALKSNQEVQKKAESTKRKQNVLQQDFNTKSEKDNVCQKRNVKQKEQRLSKPVFFGSHKCEVCRRSFKWKTNLLRHLKTVHKINAGQSTNNIGEKYYTCDICQRQFHRKDYIISHLKVHNEEKPYECNTCQHQFKDKSNYRRHLQLHTGEKSKLHTEEKPYKCNTCQSQFKQKHHLKSHLRIHTGEKPYECNFCKGRFNHKSHLNTHLKTHTGEKPYECHICKRRFNRKAHVRSHLRTHNPGRS